MASADVWLDFESLRHNVKLNTVDRLKLILTRFNEQCGTNLTKGGKKQELIERITRELDLWKRTSNVEKWTKAKNILAEVRSSMYTSYRPAVENSYASSSHSVYSPAASTSSIYQTRPPVAPSSIPRYEPYGGPGRKPTLPTTGSTSTPAHIPIQFKHSPFFRVDRAVSQIVECPESTSQMDRKQQSLTFQITNEIIAKLNSTSSKYQLRLYCTSSAYYSPTGFRQTTGSCPIEFPPTCEVRVNSTQLNVNLKGMKKKPGTAPPPDLGKLVRVANGASNRVDLIYVNSQQPLPCKKYYMVVMLVEVTSVEQLVDRLRKGKYRSSSEILAKMMQTSSSDDDIIAGSQKLSLKCPLSYMRISTPCRSSMCVHSQCFDAFSWYSVMEQTTTWLCPVCEKVLNTEELIVDGYFDEILKGTSEDVEDVIVEADGQWHTSDNKYASAAWKATHTLEEAVSLPPTPVKRRSPSLTKLVTNGNGAHLKSGPHNAEIVVLDSDDEDEGQVKRELSPTAYRSMTASLASLASNPPRSQTAESEVIDLTLDSDDEVSPPSQSQSQLRSQSSSQSRTQSHTLKRKSDDRDITSPTEAVWSKKSRTDASLMAAVVAAGSNVGYVNGANGTNGTPFSPPRDPGRTLPPPSPSRYSSAYARPPTYSGSYMPPGLSPVAPRPPLPIASSLPANNYSASPITRSNGTGTPSTTQTWRA